MAPKVQCATVQKYDNCLSCYKKKARYTCSGLKYLGFRRFLFEEIHRNIFVCFNIHKGNFQLLWAKIL